MLAAALFYGCDKPATDTTETASTEQKEQLSAEELVNNPNTANAQEIQPDAAVP